MQKGHILALCISGAVVFLLWTSFLVWMIGGSDVRSLPKDLGKAASVGDTFGILNSLFTGVALAAIVVAIFMQARQLFLQAQQLQDQVETNNLYKKEVEATLENLKRENAWKSVESKMHLIPLLSEAHENELSRLAKTYKVASLEASPPRQAYKSKDKLAHIDSAIEGFATTQSFMKDTLAEKRAELDRQHGELLTAIEDVNTAGGDMSDLQENYAELVFSLHDQIKSNKSQAEQIDANNEGIEKMRAVLRNLQKLNEEYDQAFQKAYSMTSDTNADEVTKQSV